MKRTLLFLIALVFIFTLSGCNSNIKLNNSKASSTQPTGSPKVKINIFFIGNSLTFVGKIPQKFEALAKLTNKPVNVLEKTNGGYNLWQHYEDLTSGSYNDYIKKANIVILQEYGKYGLDTANYVKKIQKLFKPSTKFYFLLTEFDIPGRLDELKDIKNLTYIPSGYAHNLLLRDGFKYEQLHVANDYHPNSLYGYIGALTVYSKIFNTSCIGLSYDFLDQSLIPGDTKAEKDNAIKKIQEKVMEAVNAKQSDYN